MQKHDCHANVRWCDEHAFRCFLAAVTFEGAYQSCLLGMPVMLAGMPVTLRVGMPVMDHASHARWHASHAHRGMPVTEEHARHA